MITSQIYQWARTQPQKPAIVSNGHLIDYAHFWRLIEATRRFFAQQQLPEGHTAIVLIPRLLDSWVLTLALRNLGINTVSVQHWAQAKELRIKDLACLITTQSLQNEHQLMDHVSTRVIIVPGDIFDGCHEGELVFDQRHVRPAGGQILYTSGTTGIYKQVMLSGTQETKRNAARASSWGFDRDTVLHGLDFPLWTGAGFKQPLAVWYTGGCVVFDQGADKFKRFFEFKLTKATVVESMLRELLNAQTDRIADSGFELVFGASFLSLGLAEAVRLHLTSNINIHYGCTELATYVLHARYKNKEDLYWMTPATDRIVQIVDRNGVECAVGEEGELRVLLTDIDATAYLDDPETSANVFRNGYFYPGDIAVARADGRIRILGRSADVLNVQGDKLAVTPMEQIIQQYLGIDEVCLFSAMNERGEDELVIAIRSDHAPPVSELQELHPNFKRFESVRVAALKEFPRAESGMRKVHRAALRKLVF
ncbi:MAG TPA: class I adenylate-forming enzyme family protein [Methylophilaceae bacterium]|jgi:acyl-coenzyme A synthetase/AMP-(fatty) acid ligase